MPYEDDKRRRNLVVFSALVLLVAWLDIPIGAIAGKFLADSPLRVGEGRVWIAILVVLGYLAHRFRFAPDHRRNRRLMSVAFGRRLKGSAEASLERAIRGFIRTKKEPYQFSGNVRSIVRRGQHKLLGGAGHPDYEGAEAVDVKAVVHSMPEIILDGRFGDAEITTFHHVGEEPRVSAGPLRLGFRMRPELHLWSRGVTMVATLLWTEQSTEWLLPWLLFVGAAVVGAFQLWRSFAVPILLA